MASKTLLVVAHTPSANLKRLCDAVVGGAQAEEIEDVAVTVKPPLEAGPADVLACDAIILGTPENLGYMSGALKDFFDRIFYAMGDATDGLRYAAYIRAGKDGTGTYNAIKSITTGLRWRPLQDPIILHGAFREEFVDQCAELGMTVAAGLDAGIF